MAAKLAGEYAYLLNPIKDPEKSWEINFETILQDYKAKTYPDEDDVPNFALAGLLLQALTGIYLKKVDSLHSLLLKVIEKLHSIGAKPPQKAIKNKDSTPKPNDDFDFVKIKIAKNIDLDETLPIIRKPKKLNSVPLSLIPLDETEKGIIMLKDIHGEDIGNKRDFFLNICKMHRSGFLLLPTLFFDEKNDKLTEDPPSDDDDDNDNEPDLNDNELNFELPRLCNSAAIIDEPPLVSDIQIQDDRPPSVLNEINENLPSPAVNANEKNHSTFENNEQNEQICSPPPKRRQSLRLLLKSTPQETTSQQQKKTTSQKLEEKIVESSTKQNEYICSPVKPTSEVKKRAAKKKSKPLTRKTKAIKKIKENDKHDIEETLYHTSPESEKNEENVQELALENPPSPPLLDFDRPDSPISLGSDSMIEGDNVPKASLENVVESYEEYMLSNINNYMQDLNRYKEVNENAEDLRNWEQSVKSSLEEQKKHEHYDIHVYGRRILDRFENNNRKQVLSFKEICHKMKKWQIHRYFLALLLLANRGNVEILQTEQPDGEVEIEVVLLSRKMHHEDIEDFEHVNGEHGGK